MKNGGRLGPGSAMKGVLLSMTGADGGLCATGELGRLPDEKELEGVPRAGRECEGTESGESGGAKKADMGATQTASLMALLQTRAEGSLPSKLTKVWLGEGLGSIAKRTHERMLRWEFINLGELRPKNPLDKTPQESDTQKTGSAA